MPACEGARKASVKRRAPWRHLAPRLELIILYLNWHIQDPALFAKLKLVGLLMYLISGDVPRDETAATPPTQTSVCGCTRSATESEWLVGW